MFILLVLAAWAAQSLSAWFLWHLFLVPIGAPSLTIVQTAGCLLLLELGVRDSTVEADAEEGKIAATCLLSIARSLGLAVLGGLLSLLL